MTANEAAAIQYARVNVRPAAEGALSCSAPASVQNSNVFSLPLQSA